MFYAGIDTGQEATHAAYLRKGRKGWELVALKTFSFNDDVKPLDKEIIVSALPSRDTLVRTCELQIKREKDLPATLNFQIEPLLPYPVENAIVEAQLIEKKAKGMLLTAFAVRHNHIQVHLNQMEKRGLVPEKITCAPYALTALTSLFPQTASPQFLVHEGEKEVTCLLVQQGKLLATHAFDRSREVGTEVQKTILSFSLSHKNKTFETIFLIGKESESIQNATGKPVLFPSLSTLSLTQEELLKYGLAIGTALAGEGINFRKPPFQYPRKWQRVKKPLIASIALSFLLISSLIAFGQFSLFQKKQVIEKTYRSFLQKEGFPIENFSLKTPGDYHASLNKLETEIQKLPDTFPLLPSIPKARETLTWLSTHQGISVDSFHYFLERRPDFSHKKERYKVKVELEFSATDSNTANAFYKMLSSPNPIIDSNEKVLWTPGKGKYQASFYLKDKTRYGT